MAKQLMRHAGAARADAASEFAIDATQAEGYRPGRGDPIGDVAIGTTAIVATVISIAHNINAEEAARHGEIQRNTSQIDAQFEVELAILLPIIAPAVTPEEDRHHAAAGINGALTESIVNKRTIDKIERF